jgi:hypothetical protein
MAGINHNQRIVVPESGRMRIYPSSNNQGHNLTIQTNPTSPSENNYLTILTSTPMTASLPPTPASSVDLGASAQQLLYDNVQLQQALACSQARCQKLELHVTTLEQQYQGLVSRALRADLNSLELQGQLASAAVEIEQWKKRYAAIASKAGEERDAGITSYQTAQCSTGSASIPQEQSYDLENKIQTIERERDALQQECRRLQEDNIAAHVRIEALVSGQKAVGEDTAIDLVNMEKPVADHGEVVIATQKATTAAQPSKTRPDTNVIQSVKDHISDLLPAVNFDIRHLGEAFFKSLKENGHIVDYDDTVWVCHCQQQSLKGGYRARQPRAGGHGFKHVTAPGWGKPNRPYVWRTWAYHASTCSYIKVSRSRVS